MEDSDFSWLNAKKIGKCKFCKKAKGDHQAVTLNCPMGAKTRVGYCAYEAHRVFKEKKVMKVWGGDTFQAGKQIRTLVCAKTKTRAVELLARFHVSLGHLNTYWSETGNEVELAVAVEEGVYLASGVGNECSSVKNYKKI
jgi:hypothetical protein